MRTTEDQLAQLKQLSLSVNYQGGEYGYLESEFVDVDFLDLPNTKQARFVKLPPNTGLIEHTDYLHRKLQRYLVGVFTNEDSTNTVDGDTIKINEGDIVAINPRLPHSGTNGNSDRIHLVVDLQTG